MGDDKCVISYSPNFVRLAKVNDKKLFKEIVKGLYLYHPHPHTIHTKMEVLNIFKGLFHNLKYFLVLLR